MAKPWTTLGKAAALAVSAATLAACSVSEAGCSQGSATLAMSCAAGVEYHDEFYTQWSVRQQLVKGPELGPAEYPPCNDTGCGTIDEAGSPTTVWRLKGLDPADAVLGEEEGTGRLRLFVRLGVEPKDILPQLKQATNPR